MPCKPVGIGSGEHIGLDGLAAICTYTAVLDAFHAIAQDIARIGGCSAIALRKRLFKNAMNIRVVILTPAPNRGAIQCLGIRGRIAS